jgi:hypothetical protein
MMLHWGKFPYLTLIPLPKLCGVWAIMRMSLPLNYDRAPKNVFRDFVLYLYCIYCDSFASTSRLTMNGGGPQSIILGKIHYVSISICYYPLVPDMQNGKVYSRKINYLVPILFS